MNTQLGSTASGVPLGAVRTLRSGRVLPLGSAGGKLEVLHGRVWLTRAGDRDDHFVDLGQSVVIPASGRVLVEAIDADRPALIAWHPASIVERIGAALRSTFGRCWEIVDPARRIGAGTVAAAIALVAGALLFGPLSDERTLALARAAVLHNSAGPSTRLGADARSTPRAPRPDAGAELRERARSATQEARRRTPGVA